METPRWKIITPSQYEHERRALDFVRAGLPDHDPYRAWSNFEFVTNDGAIYEVDLLVLTKQGFFLVEIKSWPGRVRGDVGTWTRTTPEGRVISDDNPVLLANRKAKALSSLLKAQSSTKKIRVPWLDAIVFLSADDLHCEPRFEIRRLVSRSGSSHGSQSSTEPGLTPKRLIGSPSIVISCTHDLALYAEKLGEVADQIAKSDPLLPRLRVFQELYDVAQPPPVPGCQPLSNERLIKLAAAMSSEAAVSSRQELYPHNMEALRALKLGIGALSGLGLGDKNEGFTIWQVHNRVSSRYTTPLDYRQPSSPSNKTGHSVSVKANNSKSSRTPQRNHRMINKTTANETMTDKAQAAFNQAAVKVVQRAKNTGTPIIVWQDGAVKELTVEQFEAAQKSEQPSTDSNGGPN